MRVSVKSIKIGFFFLFGECVFFFFYYHYLIKKCFLIHSCTCPTEILAVAAGKYCSLIHADPISFANFSSSLDSVKVFVSQLLPKPVTYDGSN